MHPNVLAALGRALGGAGAERESVHKAVSAGSQLQQGEPCSPWAPPGLWQQLKMPKVLTLAQRLQFYEHGWLQLEGVVPADWLRRLQAEMAAQVQQRGHSDAVRRRRAIGSIQSNRTIFPCSRI